MLSKRLLQKTIPIIIIVALCFLWYGKPHSFFAGGLQGSFRSADLRYNMSYVYFGSSGLYDQHVDRTCGSLDEISPNYFNLTRKEPLC
jgi:hypothetical protein